MSIRSILPTLLSITIAASLATAAPAAATTVCIDPGHGGRYSNANANGLMEKNVNLAIGLALRDALEAQGVDTVMTRTTDRSLASRDIPTWNWSSQRSRYLYKPDYRFSTTGLPKDDLQARANVANKAGADIFISIHGNGSANTSARGTEDYASRGDPLGRELAGYVQREVVRQTGLRDRGAFTAEFYVLRWSNMPAILIESGFISNPSDAALLKSPSFRTRFARAVAAGVKAWLDTDPYDRLWPRTTGASTAQLAAMVSAKDFPTGANSVVLVRHDTYADAMTAPLLARVTGSPLLFVGSGWVPNSTREELARLNPSVVRLVGLDGSYSDALKQEIAGASGVPASSFVEYAGVSRAQVARQTADLVRIPSSGEIAIAPPGDAEATLAAASYATRARVPLLLTDQNWRGTNLEQYLSEHRGEIRRVKAFGSTATMTTRMVSGLPGLTRVHSRDRAWFQAMPHQYYFNSKGTGSMRPIVVNAKIPQDRFVAARHSARVDQPVILVEDNRMPNRTRRFITNRWRSIGGFEVLDESGRIRMSMDWALKKADYRWN